MIKDYFKFSVTSLTHRKLRSFLTVLGIVIGIAAVVSLITISSGLDNAIKAQFEKLGTDRIYVMPKGLGNPATLKGLTIDDQQILENIPEIDYVIPLYYTKAKAEYRRESSLISLIGWPEEFTSKLKDDYDLGLTQGSYFSGQKYAVLVGYLAAKDMFDDKINIRSKIYIEGQEFKVIGILEEIGNPEDDNQFYIPLSTARELFNDDDSVSAFDVKVKPGIDMDYLVDKIKKKLEQKRGDDNFDVYTSEQLLEQADVILGILKIVIGGIAAISLVVGGIGIMNSMFTSILERTREIGIMKSIGATKKNILMIFLVESSLMGFIGGFIGISIGSGISLLVGFIAKLSNFQLLKIVIDPNVLLIAIGFSTIIGCISGMIPAYQASKMRPVEALGK